MIVCLLMCSNLLYSQEKPTYNGGTGYFFIGQTNIDFTSAKSAYNISDIAIIPTKALNVGGGGFGVFGNFIIGGEGGAMQANAFTTDHISHTMITTMSGYGMFNFGYMIPQKSRFLIYPLFGLGSGVTQLTEEEKLWSPPIDVTYNHTNTNVFFKTELNIDLFSNSENYFKEKKGFSVGLTIGYMFHPYASSWDYDERGRNVLLPQVLFNGPYARLRIGGGGFDFK